ncbi:MAG: family NAD(P)-dependent oxidoreductase [Sphingobacteriaceae bacterium]|jgi:nucleoside-diphosphate-sugar epimerase|nr:family NAD(P)-dependent oxidoreductase [Sphingobacteriaceae bacterium]
MILVTGATGFLGSELVKQLVERGDKVRALKRFTSKIPELLSTASSVEWFEADILDYFALEEAFEGIDEVYHCAAFVSFDTRLKKKIRKVNLEGTQHIVNLSLDKQIRKLVHVSSIAALGDAKEGGQITEKDQWEFTGIQNDYAVSKYQSEMEVWRGIAEGLNAVIVNPSIIIGKNAGKEGSGKIFETVRKGMKFYTVGSCGYVDVEDVAKSMILLMNSPISGERFILNAQNRSFRDLFSETAKNFNLPAPSIKVKPWMMSLASKASAVASIFTGERIITKYTAHSASVRQEYANSKIRQATGIDFKSLSQTIAEICSTLKNG